MDNDLNLILTSAPLPYAMARFEICEHKGHGHPDSLCDGASESVSQALCAEYLRTFGEIRHHNVDKALLIGGQSMPKFRGGQVNTNMRLIVAGRADGLPGKDDVADLVITAARRYLASALQVSPDLFEIESAVRTGSPNLRRVIASAGSAAVSNDTSFGVGFAPYSALEQVVLYIAQMLRSDSFKEAFRVAGDDFKIMGNRVDQKLGFTIALAFIDREVWDVRHYFALKQAMMEMIAKALPASAKLRINTLDDPSAKDEGGIYLTVTGLSAEHGDDGQVGRGNRVSGLITPSRWMSLEAAAGKNPVSHVGKIYNVLANVIANDLVSQVDEIDEAAVQLLSAIGEPINRPQLVAIQVCARSGPLPSSAVQCVRDIVHGRLDTIQTVSTQLAQGKLRVF